MKTNYLITTTLICALAVWLGTTSESCAGGGHDHEGGHEAGHHAAQETHEAHAGAADRENLRTVTELWAAIDADVDRLSQTINSGKLSDVHKAAFAIRDLVNELPGKSADLPEARQKMLTGYIARVAEHAKNLDTYGDAGDAGRTAVEFTELEKRLGHMKNLYPKSDSGDAHEEHSH